MIRIRQKIAGLCWGILAGIVTATTLCAAPTDTVPARVRRVLDGNTIVVVIGEDKKTMRLQGIEAPEMASKNVWKKNDPSDYKLDNTAKMQRALQQKAYRAGQFLAYNLKKQRKVLVQTTGQEGDQLVGLVFPRKGANPLGLAAIKAGHAKVQTGQHDFPEEAQYLRAQVKAMTARRGIWSLLKQSSSPPAFFIGIHANTEGVEFTNLNDEYVVIGNISTSKRDLSGHIVRDAENHDFVIPPKTVLEPGQSLIIRTGTGDNKDLELYRNMDGPVWNNEGDTVHLLRPDDTEITRLSYDRQTKAE